MWSTLQDVEEADKHEGKGTPRSGPRRAENQVWERDTHKQRIVLPCTSAPNSTTLRLLQKAGKHPYWRNNSKFIRWKRSRKRAETGRERREWLYEKWSNVYWSWALTTLHCNSLYTLVSPSRLQAPCSGENSQLILLSPECGHRAWHTVGSQYIIVLGFFVFTLFWLCWVFVAVRGLCYGTWV